MHLNQIIKVGGQAVLGRQFHHTTPWLTERDGYGNAYDRYSVLLWVACGVSND